LGFDILVRVFWGRRTSMKLRGIGLVIFGWTLGVAVCLAQTTSAVPAKSDGTFAPFEQWKSMVLAGDAAGLKTLYSVNPVARIVTASGRWMRTRRFIIGLA
jgi:hypothetical protein